MQHTFIRCGFYSFVDNVKSIEEQIVREAVKLILN